MMLFSVVVMVATLAMVQGCSESEGPVESVTELTNDNVDISDTLSGERDVSIVALAKWDPSGYQNAIILEAKHALSRRNNGTSSQIALGCYVGDWDYVNNNPYARNVMSAHYGWNWGYIGSPGISPDYPLTKNWRGIGRGGQCKFFADLVQWRATGGRKGFLPQNSSASGSINNVQPGDVIQKVSGTDHTAIVIAILARSGSRVTAVDVIDANYTGGNGKCIISRHPISGSTLQLYHTYH